MYLLRGDSDSARLSSDARSASPDKSPQSSALRLVSASSSSLPPLRVTTGPETSPLCEPDTRGPEVDGSASSVLLVGPAELHGSVVRVSSVLSRFLGDSKTRMLRFCAGQSTVTKTEI